MIELVTSKHLLGQRRQAHNAPVNFAGRLLILIFRPELNAAVSRVPFRRSNNEPRPNIAATASPGDPQPDPHLFGHVLAFIVWLYVQTYFNT